MGRRTAPSAEGTERFRAKRDEVSVTCEASRLRCGDASSRRKQWTMRVTMKELAATAASRLRAPKLRALREFHVQLFVPLSHQQV